MALAATTIIFGGSIKRPVRTELAKSIEVSEATIYRWKADPDLIPLGKFKRICRNLDLTDEQILQIVKAR